MNEEEIVLFKFLYPIDHEFRYRECVRGGGEKEVCTALMMPEMISSMKIITVDWARPAFRT
jgi:hypothetical protein